MALFCRKPSSLSIFRRVREFVIPGTQRPDGFIADLRQRVAEEGEQFVVAEGFHVEGGEGDGVADVAALQPDRRVGIAAGDEELAAAEAVVEQVRAGVAETAIGKVGPLGIAAVIGEVAIPGAVERVQPAGFA